MEAQKIVNLLDDFEDEFYSKFATRKWLIIRIMDSMAKEMK